MRRNIEDVRGASIDSRGDSIVHVYEPLPDRDQQWLEHTMTVRIHRRWDLNDDDPFVSVSCGGRKVQAITDGESRGYACPPDTIAVGTLDLRAALAAKDPHALQVCKARTDLFVFVSFVAYLTSSTV